MPVNCFFLQLKKINVSSENNILLFISNVCQRCCIWFVACFKQLI
jgi:hypothetical protein